MYKIDFSKPARVHFIGIGGISMSGLAQILLNAGFTVSGSDRAPSELTEKLEKEGVTVYYGQRSENIKEGTDLVVFTAAIKEDNPEYMQAKTMGIPLMARADLLGQIMKNFVSFSREFEAYPLGRRKQCKLVFFFFFFPF